MKVVKVLNTELGWDNVVGIFNIDLLERCEELFQGQYYIIEVETVSNDLCDFE